MDWLGDIAGTLLSAGTGGLFGMLGSILSVGAKWLQEKQRQAWEQKKWAHEETLINLQMKQRQAETEQEIALADSAGSWSGLSASIASDTAATSNAPAWVTAIKALYRPVLTTGLVVLVYFVWADLIATVQGAEGSPLLEVLSAAETKEILKYMVTSIVFAASTAIVWWFGERAMSPPGQK